MSEYSCSQCGYIVITDASHDDGQQCPRCKHGRLWGTSKATEEMILENDLGEKFMVTRDGVKKCVKPPLGLTPHKYWVEERLININNAVARYMETNTPIPAEWIEEYNKLVEDINNAT